MSTLISSAVAATALAASLGTGTAAVPASATTIAPAAFTQNGPQRPNPPHRFRLKFNNLQQCRARAAHDHPGRPGDWDCRRGPDRNNPWEYWGR
ncbi:MAG TPA: hypothetical protein VL595_04815 [Pseudonocardia sp.]|jgi:hypothetical protein|nr:hypothetical protein [Pseudonocardia sp.]